MNVRHGLGAVRRRLSLVVLAASVLLVLVGAGALAAPRPPITAVMRSRREQ
jgi:hypothetical protein